MKCKLIIYLMMVGILASFASAIFINTSVTFTNSANTESFRGDVIKLNVSLMLTNLSVSALSTCNRVFLNYNSTNATIQNATISGYLAVFSPSVTLNATTPYKLGFANADGSVCVHRWKATTYPLVFSFFNYTNAFDPNPSMTEYYDIMNMSFDNLTVSLANNISLLNPTNNSLATNKYATFAYNFTSTASATATLFINGILNATASATSDTINYFYKQFNNEGYNNWTIQITNGGGSVNSTTNPFQVDENPWELNGTFVYRQGASYVVRTCK